MIEVTDEMLQVLKDYCKFYISDADAIECIIELHEQSKLKPVGYVYPSEYEKALQDESCCLMFVVPVTNLDTGEESSLPLYATLPTRKSLCEEEIEKLVPWQGDSKDPFFNRIKFARVIEQAHGIH